MADWNEEPPDDPLSWGITVSAMNEKERKLFKETPYDEFSNVIVSLIKIRDNEKKSEGFTLKEETRLRIYALGERSNARRGMADYAFILDAQSRARVWAMQAEHSYYAGGASKNRFVDEVITLPRGDYIVTYLTDDSHAYDDWNDDPPSDQEHYGVTIMGVGGSYNAKQVEQFVEQRDKNIIARLVLAGNDADLTEKFTLNKATKLRIYAIGEGQNREMVDYGWIEDARTGTAIWEMTYGMTFHAGGGRKNRMVNTTLILEKGEYRLRYRSDDSHSYNDWNVDPPDDQEGWGITLYRDDRLLVPGPLGVPIPYYPPRAPEPRDDE
jgi:hypothetical protein